jgi:tRNA(Arg) A34 adenosine deaminase TadA
MLRRRVIDGRLRVGVRLEEDDLLSNAWVEWEGAVLNETPDVGERDEVLLFVARDEDDYMVEDEVLMGKAIRLALAAREKGNHPFGALLAVNGRVLASAENRVNSEADITRHAELNLISLASRQLDPEVLSEATLYKSTEPCAMCAGAIYWAGISRVVYGCSAEKLGEMAGASFVIPCRHIFDFGKRHVSVIGPILEVEATAVHIGFWG